MHRDPLPETRAREAGVRHQDLRAIPRPERADHVLPLFWELPRGRGLTLTSDSDEPELLELLQQRHAGEFEWEVLEAGPPLWRLVLAKRAAGLPRRRQVLEFMEHDHRRIHELVDQLRAAARRGDREALTTLAVHLRTGLARHFRVEEEVLLPVIAERMGSPRGPAAVLRDEHLQISALVDGLLQASQDGEQGSEQGGVTDRAEELATILTNHSGMEERILYAVTDLLLSEEERDQLVRRCQRL